MAVIGEPLMPNCEEDNCKGCSSQHWGQQQEGNVFADTSTQEEDNKGSKHGLLNSDKDPAVTTIPHFLLLERSRKGGIVIAGHLLLHFDNLCLVLGTASPLCQQSCSPPLCPSVAGPSFHRIPIPLQAGEEKITACPEISVPVRNSHRQTDWQQVPLQCPEGCWPQSPHEQAQHSTNLASPWGTTAAFGPLTWESNED